MPSLSDNDTELVTSSADVNTEPATYNSQSRLTPSRGHYDSSQLRDDTSPLPTLSFLNKHPTLFKMRIIIITITPTSRVRGRNHNRRIAAICRRQCIHKLNVQVRRDSNQSNNGYRLRVNYGNTGGCPRNLK